MKHSPFLIAVLLLLAVSTSGCDFVGDVIEFGLWTVLIILVLIVVIIWLLVKMFTR